MRKFYWFFFVFVKTGFCALSPLNQSVQEMRAFLDSKELLTLPQGEVVEKIFREENTFYLFTTNYSIEADIHYKQQSRLGPRKFFFQFQELRPL